MFLSRLKYREQIPELMDDPQLDANEHRHALSGLARINRLSGSANLLWPEIVRWSRTLQRPISVLDVATGSGDVPAELLLRAQRAQVALHLTGCDVSPIAVAAAQAKCPGGTFFVHDILQEPPPGCYDVVTCSLFLHHLTEGDATTLLQHLKCVTGKMILVNDLARSRWNYVAVWLACHALTRSRVVRFDGPASVRSALTPSEVLALAERSGFNDAKVRSYFPCRYLLLWECS